MPQLSFSDVFSPEKAQVLKTLEQLEQANKAYGVFIIYWMKKNNITNFTINREEFKAVLPDDTGASIVVSQKGNVLNIRIEDNDNSYS